jgi:hypothetical protein
MWALSGTYEHHETRAPAGALSSGALAAAACGLGGCAPVPLGQPLTGSAAAVDSVAFSPGGHTLYVPQLRYQSSCVY